LDFAVFAARALSGQPRLVVLTVAWEALRQFGVTFEPDKEQTEDRSSRLRWLTGQLDQDVNYRSGDQESPHAA
jgi:hypothetical protein